MARSKHPALNPPDRPIPSTHILPPSADLKKHLSKLSKPTLLELVFTWLASTKNNPPDFSLTEEDIEDGVEDSDDDDNNDDDVEDDGGGSGGGQRKSQNLVEKIKRKVEKARDEYEGIKTRKGIVDRCFEREWRGGLSMLQVAQVDVRYLLEHGNGQRWTVGELVLQGQHAGDVTVLPKFHPQVFIKSLQSLISSMTQCHYYTITHPTLPLNLLRLSLHSPQPLPKHLPPPNQILYLALPHSSPHIFFTASRSPFADIVRSSLSAALSSQHCRFDIQSTSLSARTLEALCELKGAQRGAGGKINGGWMVYNGEGVDDSPLELKRRAVGGIVRDGDGSESDTSGRNEGKRMKEEGEGNDHDNMIKRRKIAEGRMGPTDGAQLDRVQFHLRELFPARSSKQRTRKTHNDNNDNDENADNDDDREEDETRPYTLHDWRPQVTIVLEGSHVFAGVRTLVEEGVIDGIKMPGWMTGEEGKSVGIVMDRKVLETRREIVGMGGRR